MGQFPMELEGELSRSAAFATTHWSVALAARDGQSPDGSAALAKLCQVYWYPIYAYLRRRGHDSQDAQDLTQGFFAALIQREYLRVVDPGKGRFRTFLLVALDRFVSKERLRARRLKRGGGCPVISLDSLEVEERYRAEPADGLTPEKLFARRWTLTVLEQTLKRLGEECAVAGRQALFRSVESLLAGDSGETTYASLAARIGMTPNALKVAVHRLRRRYADLLREEIAATVASPDQIEDELRYLLSSLSA